MNVEKRLFVDYDEASRILHLRKSYLYKLTHEGRLPCYRPGGKGGKVLFAVDELEAYILRGKVSANYELDAQAEAILNSRTRGRRKAVSA
jgi:excisionase family DNA binding protein